MHLIAAHAVHTPYAPAIMAPGRPALTYDRLSQHLQDMRHALQAMGIGAKDRVALVHPNGPEMAVAFLSVAASATCAPLNPAYRSAEFEFYLSDLSAKALLIQRDIDSHARVVAQSRGIPIIEISPRPEAEAGLFTLATHSIAGTSEVEPVAPTPESPALALHTSRTTARPKLVPLSHINLLISAQNIVLSLALTAQDRCLNIMPLFHIHGLVGALLSSIVAGASVVCTSGFDTSVFFDSLVTCHPARYTAVPTMHQAIRRSAAQHREAITHFPLRFIRSCSAPLPPPEMFELEKVFGVPVLEAYGMTEAAHQIACNPLPSAQRKAGSVGIATGPEIALMDEAGNLLPVDTTGEVVVRGATITRGYIENPAASAQAFVEGWFRTGDLGFIDTEGYLFPTGRVKELINRGGEKIVSREIEDVLLG